MHSIVFRFLKDLNKNNNRDWFKDNKSYYEDARTEFEDLVADVINEIIKFDKTMRWLQAKDCIFRIYRDTRFSKDKTPYKTHFGAHLLTGGRKTEQHRAGYYIRVEPGNNLLASGAYLPPSGWLSSIRQQIDVHAADLKKILKAKSFKGYFGELEGDRLKTAPRGYPKDHAEIELLKYKSFLAVHSLTNKQVQEDDFSTYAGKVFKAAYPFKEFLNRQG